MRQMLAIAALAGAAAAMAQAAPAAAQAGDRSVTTEWVAEPLATGQEIEVQRGRPFLVAQVMPGELVATAAPLPSPGGEGEIMPAATKLFRLRTASTPVYCTVHGRSRWGIVHRILPVHICLVDEDRDGQFESYYEERADHAFLPLFRGTFPAQRTAIPPLAFARLPATDFIREFESLGVRQDSRMSIFLKWNYAEITCFVGMPRHRVMHEPLTEFVRLPPETAAPSQIEICGTRLTVVSRQGGSMRLRVDRAYPATPIDLFVPWQLF